MHVTLRHLLAGLHIDREFVVQTALEFGTLSGKFLGIGADVLETCGSGVHTGKDLHPGGTAEFAAAGTDTSDASGFLAGADLLHLYADVKGFGKHLDEFAEVDTCIGNIVEYGLVAVALVFDVANLHVELELLGNLAALNHGRHFASLRFVPFFDVDGTCLAVDTTDFGAGFQAGLLHLQGHKASGEGDCADVVTGIGFNGNDVALHEVEAVVVAIVAFAGVLELDFHEVGSLVIARNIAQVIIGIELLVAATASARRKTTQCGIRHIEVLGCFS